MTYDQLGSHGKWLIITSTVLASILLSGCEQDNETQSVTAPAQPQQMTQPAGVSLSPMPMQVGTPASMPENPHDKQDFAMLGDTYFQAQKYPEAIALYEKAISLNSQDVGSMNDLGLAYFYTGQSDKALASLANATTTSPEYERAWLSTGYILLSMQRYDEAVEPLQKARDLDPQGIVGQEAARFLNKIQPFLGK